MVCLAAPAPGGAGEAEVSCGASGEVGGTGGRRGPGVAALRQREKQVVDRASHGDIDGLAVGQANATAEGRVAAADAFR